MSINGVKNYAANNLIRSCLPDIDKCCFTCNRISTVTGIVCLGISGTTAAAAGIAYVIFNQIPLSTPVLVAGSVFICATNCLGGFCLFLNRPTESERREWETQQTIAANSVEANVQARIIIQNDREQLTETTALLRDNKESIVQIKKEIQTKSEETEKLLVENEKDLEDQWQFLAQLQATNSSINTSTVP